MPHHRTHAGLTMIELLVVVAIIGTLSTMFFLYFRDVRARARDGIRVSNMDSLVKALVFYESENSFAYPSSASCTDNRCTDDSGMTPWIPGLDDRYASKMPSDPHDGQYVYVSPFGVYRYVLYFTPEEVEPDDPCGVGLPIVSVCEEEE